METNSTLLFEKLPRELIGTILHELLWLSNPWPEPMWRIRANCYLSEPSMNPIHLHIQHSIFSLRRVSKLMHEYVMQFLPMLVKDLKFYVVSNREARKHGREIYRDARSTISEESIRDPTDAVDSYDATKIRDAQICEAMLSRGWLDLDTALQALETEEYKNRLKEMRELMPTIFSDAAKIETMGLLQMELEVHVLSRLTKFCGDDVYAQFEDSAVEAQWELTIGGADMFVDEIPPANVAPGLNLFGGLSEVVI